MVTKKTKQKKRKELGFWKPLTIILFIVLFLESITLFFQTESSDLSFSDDPQVAVVSLFGPIQSEEAAASLLGSTTTISAQRIIPLLTSFEEDDQISAVILQVNSGGGYPVPSHKIAEAVYAMEKPTVVVVEDVSASGAYFISSAADHIIADDYSVIGSIGVLGSYLDLSEFIEEYNVSYQRLVGGKYKDTGSPFKELTEQERTMLQRQIDLMHNLFIEDVATYRNMSISRMRSLATGEVFLGQESVDNGLIDAVGDMRTAELYLEETLNVTSVSFTYYNEDVGLLDALFSVNVDSPLQEVFDRQYVVPQLR